MLSSSSCFGCHEQFTGSSRLEGKDYFPKKRSGQDRRQPLKAHFMSRAFCSLSSARLGQEATRKPYNLGMPFFSISEVARQMGLRPSAIRYYEQIGILPSALRNSGQRCYDTSALHRFVIVQFARQLGFTLEEIRELFTGFNDKIPASRRWQKLSRQKLADLEIQMEEMRTMQTLLQDMSNRCGCQTLDQCGKAIFKSGRLRVKEKSLPRKRWSRTTTV
jgi:MerR family transcriptional regulator, redox-sensitive transcriptional activator SoxR